MATISLNSNDLREVSVRGSGPDDEGVKKFKVEGNRRVSSDGTVRVGPEWKDLTFDCVLDPEKAVVVSFSYKIWFDRPLDEFIRLLPVVTQL